MDDVVSARFLKGGRKLAENSVVDVTRFLRGLRGGGRYFTCGLWTVELGKCDCQCVCVQVSEGLMVLVLQLVSYAACFSLVLGGSR